MYKKQTYLYFLISVSVISALYITFRSISNPTSSRPSLNTESTAAISPPPSVLPSTRTADDISQQQAVSDMASVISTLPEVRTANISIIEWDSRTPGAHLSNKEEALAELRTLPIFGDNQADRVKTDELINWLADICVASATNSAGPYYEKLKAAGEHLLTYMVAPLKTKLAPRLGENDWQLVERYANLPESAAKWSRLVKEGSKITFYQVTPENPLESTVPGEEYLDKAHGMFGLHRYTEAPIKWMDALQKERHLLKAEVILFIRHDNSTGAKIRPYAMRFWYDNAGKTWRPAQMSWYYDPTSDSELTGFPTF